MTAPEPAAEGSATPEAATLAVAVDAMGGDRGPVEIVAGARQAQEELGVPVLVVGRPDEMGDTSELEVVPASEVIGMHEDPGQGVRRKKDASLVVFDPTVCLGDRVLVTLTVTNTGPAGAISIRTRALLPSSRRVNRGRLMM